MSKKDNTGLIPALGTIIGLVFFAALGYGYFANVYKLFVYSPALAEWGGADTIRALGVFVWPVGILLGYL